MARETFSGEVAPAIEGAEFEIPSPSVRGCGVLRLRPHRHPDRVPELALRLAECYPGEGGMEEAGWA
jgi:hypothetical protein